MIFLRYLYALGLVVWLGGAATLGAVAAPSAFEVLQRREGPAGRVAGGEVVGEILRRFHLVAYGTGGLMVVSLVAMALLGPRPRPFAARLLVIGAMLVAALVSGVVVTGRIEQLRRDIPGPVAALDAGDPRRVAFGRLHALSTLLMALDVAGGLVLLYWDARGR